MCSILSGHRDWLRIGAVTNRDPGPGLTLESREEELWFCPEGVGPGEVRLQYWEGREDSLGQLVASPCPLGQSCRLEEDAAEPRD